MEVIVLPRLASTSWAPVILPPSLNSWENRLASCAQAFETLGEGTVIDLSSYFFVYKRELGLMI